MNCTPNKSYICKNCNKEYSSRQNLWKHNNKFHGNTSTENVNQYTKNIHLTNDKIDYKNNICKYCNKVLSNSQSRWRHEKTCKLNKDLEINKLQKQNEQLKIKIQKLENKTSSKTINNTNNGSIYNGNVINNINIVAPGNEKNDLTKEEIKEIFDKQILCAIKYIELINFNKNRPSNHSFCVTNRDGKHLLSYNTDKSVIESNKKKYYYLHVLHMAIYKLKEIFTKNKKSFSKDKLKEIEEAINGVEEISRLDFNNKRLKRLFDELNLLCYNSRKTVLNTWEKTNIDENDDDTEKIFLPIKNLIKTYGNNFLNESTFQYQTDSESDENSEERPRLFFKNGKKINNDSIEL